MTVQNILLTCAFASIANLAAAAIPVTVKPASEMQISLDVRAPAQVVAANAAVITAQVTALVQKVSADVGASVHAGDLLIRLDDADADLALQQARASLQALDAQIDQARQQLHRGEELFKQKYISDDELLVRRTSLQVLTANRSEQAVAVRSAELSLARTRIVAPFDATVVKRQAQVGGLAMPGTALVTLVQSDQREVEAELDPRYAAGLGNSAVVTFVSQGQSWPVSLLRLSAVIDSDSRVQLGRFRFAESVAPVGMTGEIVWSGAGGLLPVPLIVQRNGKLGVFLAEDNRARFVALPEAQEGRPAPTTLPPDASIVVRGQARLQDGDELQIAR